MPFYKHADSSEVAQDQIPDEEDDFFDYATPPLGYAAANYAIEKECINYCDEWHGHWIDNAVEIHQIKTVLTKYNTTLPSSAPVERLSTAGQIEVPRRNLFERLNVRETFASEGQLEVVKYWLTRKLEVMMCNVTCLLYTSPSPRD